MLFAGNNILRMKIQTTRIIAQRQNDQGLEDRTDPNQYKTYQNVSFKINKHFESPIRVIINFIPTDQVEIVEIPAYNPNSTLYNIYT